MLSSAVYSTTLALTFKITGYTTSASNIYFPGGSSLVGVSFDNKSW